MRGVRGRTDENAKNAESSFGEAGRAAADDRLETAEPQPAEPPKAAGMTKGDKQPKRRRVSWQERLHKRGRIRQAAAGRAEWDDDTPTTPAPPVTPVTAGESGGDRGGRRRRTASPSPSPSLSQDPPQPQAQPQPQPQPKLRPRQTPSPSPSAAAASASLTPPPAPEGGAAADAGVTEPGSPAQRTGSAAPKGSSNPARPVTPAPAAPVATAVKPAKAVKPGRTKKVKKDRKDRASTRPPARPGPHPYGGVRGGRHAVGAPRPPQNLAGHKQELSRRTAPPGASRSALLALVIVLGLTVAAVTVFSIFVAGSMRERTARFSSPLLIYPVSAVTPGECVAGTKGITGQADNGPYCYEVTDGLAIRRVTDIHTERGSDGTQQVSISLLPSDRHAFADLTRTSVGKQLAMVVRGKLITVSLVEMPVTKGRVIIAGSFSRQSADRLVQELKGS